MQEEFIYLAKTCFKSFGDRVKYWITINEPKLVAEYAYQSGLIPPSRCSEPFGNCLDGNSDVEPIIAMHNMLTLDPSIFGDYPEELQEYLGRDLPNFSIDEKNFMKNSIDFIGINHYSTSYAKDCTNSSCSATSNRAIKGFVEIVGERDDVPIGELTGIEGSYVVPRGMEEIVNLIKIRYNNKPMFITENGKCHHFGFENLPFIHFVLIRKLIEFYIYEECTSVHKLSNIPLSETVVDQYVGSEEG
ncbi:putative beta-glucosidase [Helianthus annuus]|nr:putative beta-glucosidase [Helianthus annuus]